jgi:DNA replication protein DnaC
MGEIPTWTEKRADSGSPGIKWVQCKRWRVFALDRRMKDAGFPARLVPKGFDGFQIKDELDERAKRFCELYVEHFYRQVEKGKGLGLYGGVGVGKTHLAVGACREILGRSLVRSARFWEVSNLLAHLRPTDGRSDERRWIVAECMACGVLVLDDVGSHNTTDWVREQVGMIVNHRWSNKLPMIVTSNDALEQSIGSLGERTVSRLKDATTYLELGGIDRRIGEG